jgi:outer membrane biosynthesis protein TonB
MNRLEKKCFVTVAGAHGLLFVILLVGPAFFVSSEKSDASKQITVYSSADISKALSSGGEPTMQASPLPPPPAPVTQPKPVEAMPQPPEIPVRTKPEPPDLKPVEPVVKVKPTEHGEEPAPPKKKTKRETTLNPDELVPNKPDRSKAEKEARDAARAKAAAEQRRLAAEAKEIGNAVKSLDKNLSGKTDIKFDPWVGGGGRASINYFDLVKSKFDEAWKPSSTLSDSTPKVTISITISRDGTVKGHITRRSGVVSMDTSVQNVLDAVTFVEPFPESFKEQQITGSLTFDIKAKR